VAVEGFHLLLKTFEGKEPMFFFVDNQFGTQGRYPYTLSIRDPQALFDFYRGSLHLNVVVDKEAMSAKYASRGLEVNFIDDEDVAPIITNTNPKKADNRFDPYTVSRHFFMRVFCEFLSLEWFIEETAHRIDLSTLGDHEASAFQVAGGDTYQKPYERR
jgi:hypothetical protein